MKKTILKAAIAAAVAFATISVSSVIAMAKDITYEYDIVNGKQYVDGVESTNNFFNDNKASATPSEASFTAGTFELKNGTTVTANKGRKMESSTKITFTTTSFGKDADITLAYTTNKSVTAAAIKLDGSDTTTANDTSLTTYTGALATGDHTIERGSSGRQAILFYVKVVDHLSDTAKDYTLSGKTNLKGETFTLGEDSVKTNADGSWSVSATADKSPYVVGEKLKVSLKGYTAVPDEVTISAVDGSDVEFTTEDIEFTEIEFIAIPESKTYTGADIAEGRPYFDNVDYKALDSGTEIKFDAKKGFTFKLSKTATITIEGRSDNEKTAATFTLANRTKDVPQKASKDDKTYRYYVFENVPAGDVTFTVGGTNSYVKTIQIEYTDNTMADNKVKMGDDYAIASSPSTFVIHPVTEEDLAYDTLTLQGSGISTDTVYTSVELPDGSIVTAEDLGAKALYAVEVTLTDGKTTPNTALVWELK